MITAMAWTPEEYRQRPRDFDPALADVIVERVANGENLYEICLDDRDYPMPATFLRWVKEDPRLQELYDEALQFRTDLLVDQMLHYSNGADPKKARNQIDARRFHAERLMPGKYGPRAFNTNLTKPEEDKGAGIDYGAEVRRKLEAMSDRRKAEQEQAG